MKKLKVLVVNLDNINYTKDCLLDLSNQTNNNFDIVLVDQNSSEKGTKEFLDSLEYGNLEIIRNDINKPLNLVWNWFKETYENELLCFLNNDVRLSTNFIDTTISVFDKEPSVGIVVHTTNHENFIFERDELVYKIVEPYKFFQGWDFTVRRNLMPTIPDYIKTYCGDDFIYHNIYTNGYNLCYVLNSPVIHYEGSSKKSMKTSGFEDIIAFKQNNNPHYLQINQEFSRIKPTFKTIVKC